MLPAILLVCSLVPGLQALAQNGNVLLQKDGTAAEAHYREMLKEATDLTRFPGRQLLTEPANIPAWKTRYWRSTTCRILY